MARHEPRPRSDRQRAAAAPPSPLLLAGFAIASIGGPVALVYQLLPSVIGSAALPSIGLVLLLALALFAFPVAVWWRFSGRIASAGGLYGFVEASAGRAAARLHGAVWIVSYFLYLPATVTYVVYELLPALAPGLVAYRSTLQLLLPLAFTATVLVPLRISLPVVLLLAVSQLAFLGLLGALEIGRVGFPLHSLATHGNDHTVGRATLAASLLLLCASLPLYLGTSAVGAGITLRRSIAGATALVGAAALFAAVPLAAVPSGLLASELPADAVANAYAGHTLAVAAGALTISSILALVFAEFLALGRLLTALSHADERHAVLAVGALFLLADALALLAPNHAYQTTLRPSLAALYLSQLIVFVVYPRFETSRRLSLATPVAALATAPLLWGLYLVATNQIAS